MTRLKSRIITISVVLIFLTVLISTILCIGGSYSSPRPRATQATFILLEALMSQYQSTHPPLTTATNLNPETSWVQALQSDPQIAPNLAAKLSSNRVHQPVVNDDYGTPIQFIPADASKSKHAYFQSAGRDGEFGTPDDLYSNGIEPTPLNHSTI